VKHPPAPLKVDVGDLLDRPNTRRPVHHRLTLDGELAVAGSRLAPGTEVEVDLVLESMPSGVAVNGDVTFDWIGECRRCLDEVRGQAQPEVHEIFETRPTPDETFPIERAQIDLEPVVREAVLLGLPLAPLCGDDCRGPAPETFPAHKPGELSSAEDDADAEGGAGGDPRWAALDDLRFDER
jgi:uncharacterized protein